MKHIYLIVFIVISGCGGQYQEKEDWEIDAELCEAQDGTPQLLSVYNVDTGQQYFDIYCHFEDVKESNRPRCKPGGNCPTS